MKTSVCSYSPGELRKGHHNHRKNLLMLAMEMGISNVEIKKVNIPEQIFILNSLKEHSSEGLSTREIADLCGITIYKVRHLLLPLEQRGCVSRDKIKKYHKWYLLKDQQDLEILQR